MLTKRIIPCLDVKDGKVVKGVQFKAHEIVGDIVKLAEHYCEAGADELVFYDITASCDKRTVSRKWIKTVAKSLNIPFCVAGGIKTVDDAQMILNAGADKISVNSFALENPELINQLADKFGKQCVVVGIDSLEKDNIYQVFQYTGSINTIQNSYRLTHEWVKEVQERGAGEIVLNCMNHDGMKKGYDIKQLKFIREKSTVPLIASGGAGSVQDFLSVFKDANVDGALAASVFHKNNISIYELKKFLLQKKVEVRT